MWLEILEVWQRFFTWTNFRLLNVLLDSSVHFYVKSSFSENPVVSLTKNSPQHTQSIFDHPQYLMGFLIFCHSLGGVWSPWPVFSSMGLARTDPYLPCSWARNSLLPMLYLELAPSFSPTVKFIAVVPILTSVVLYKVCLQSLTSAIKIFFFFRIDLQTINLFLRDFFLIKPWFSPYQG